MTLQLNGVEIELPEDAKINVSKDGKKVTISLPEPQVVETIRIVEVEASGEVVERIRVVEVEKPCSLPHYWCTLQHYPQPTYQIPWSQPNITCESGQATSGTITTSTAAPNSSYTISGYQTANGNIIGQNLADLSKVSNMCVS